MAKITEWKFFFLDSNRKSGEKLFRESISSVEFYSLLCLLAILVFRTKKFYAKRGKMCVFVAVSTGLLICEGKYLKSTFLPHSEKFPKWELARGLAHCVWWNRKSSFLSRLWEENEGNSGNNMFSFPEHNTRKMFETSSRNWRKRVKVLVLLTFRNIHKNQVEKNCKKKTLLKVFFSESLNSR